MFGSVIIYFVFDLTFQISLISLFSSLRSILLTSIRAVLSLERLDLCHPQILDDSHIAHLTFTPNFDHYSFLKIDSKSAVKSFGEKMSPCRTAFPILNYCVSSCDRMLEVACL